MKTEHIEAQIERVTKRINLSKQDIETKKKGLNITKGRYKTYKCLLKVK